MKIDIRRLLFSILVCQFAGIIGSVFTSPSITTWYAALQKPEFAPPNWVFAPVWITLYLLMGISLYLVLERGIKSKASRIGIGFFGIQLFLNSLWSIIFFGLQNPFYALIEIVVLWIFILLTILQFWKIERRSAYLLLPYIIWVTIASSLNYYIWVLNI